MSSSSGAGIKTTGHDVARRANARSSYNINNITGIYIGEVIKNSDVQSNGRCTVHIPELGSGSTERVCLLSTPFGGNSEIKLSSDDEKSYEGSPKSYGMWTQPPAIGTNVIVLFTATLEQGIIVGTLYPRDRNATLQKPSSLVYDKELDTTLLGPSAEKNPNDTNDRDTRPQNVESKAQLIESGLLGDFVRGHSMSSSRRESPSNVMGLTTPGGHTLTMDDGAEDGNSNNIRIKSNGGSQILINDTDGFIFVSNAKGTAWVEIDQDGRIDMYSEAGVSVATDGDYNIHAKGNINMQAEQGINLKSSGGEGLKLESSVGSIDMHSSININATADVSMNLKASSNYILKATRVDINGPAPAEAQKAAVQSQTTNKNVLTSIGSRVPEKHPWLGISSIQETFNVGKGNTG